MKTITVKFTNRYNTGYNDKSYDYLVEDNTEVQAGDFAVVHNGSEFAIVRVIEVCAGASGKATKSLVTVLGKKVIEEYTARNALVQEQKEAFQRLEQLLAQESENDRYRMLAQRNAEAAALLAKLGIQ